MLTLWGRRECPEKNQDEWYNLVLFPVNNIQTFRLQNRQKRDISGAVLQELCR